MNRSKLSFLVVTGIACGLGFVGACGNGDGDDGSGATDEERATLAVKAYVAAQLDDLASASLKLQKAAPAPDADGWNAKDDAKAIADMRAAWNDARDAYERVEGAIAVLFPGLDVSTDERYDGFIEEAADDDLFDDQGVTGVHAIERILWAGEHPQKVIDFESALGGYQAAAMPATKAAADEFKNQLCALLASDTKKMRDDFEPLALDSASAFRGVIGSMQEQVEKITLAASAEDESRYAQRTLEDMRANLEGGRQVYAAFRPWLKKEAGAELDRDIEAGFDEVAAAYDTLDGVAIPPVPEGFDPDQPSADDLKTPYGKLWSLLDAQTDVENKASLVNRMLDAADAMDIPELPE